MAGAGDNEPLQPGEFELDRHGAWWVRLRRLESKNFPGRPLFFWTVGHDKVGVVWSGRGRDVDDAVETARAQFDRMKDLS